MDVIIINEDNHGILGIAESYEAAVRYLFKMGWMSKDIKIWDENIENCISFEDYISLTGITIKDIENWGIDKFNEIFILMKMLL